MIRRCKCCGKFFETSCSYQKYCSAKCRAKFFKEKSKIETEKVFVPSKNTTFQDYVKEARACNMSYGRYRMLRDVFEKSFEEIKNGI